jgi:hypothetical protein
MRTFKTRSFVWIGLLPLIAPGILFVLSKPTPAEKIEQSEGVCDMVNSDREGPYKDFTIGSVYIFFDTIVRVRDARTGESKNNKKEKISG